MASTDISDIPHVVTIDGKLYGYGTTRENAKVDFCRQIAGGSLAMRRSMMARSVQTPISDDHASEVAEMLAADVIAWA